MDALYYGPFEVGVDNAVEASKIDPLFPGMLVHTLGYASAYDGNHATYHFNPTGTGSASLSKIVPNGNRPGRLEIRSSSAGATPAEPTGIALADYIAQQNNGSAGTLNPNNFYIISDLNADVFTRTANLANPEIGLRGAPTSANLNAIFNSGINTSGAMIYVLPPAAKELLLYDWGLTAWRRVRYNNGQFTAVAF